MPKKKVETTAIVPAEQHGALAPMEPWELELAEKAKAARANEQTGVPRIEHNAQGFVIDGKRAPNLRLIILGYAFSKSYFEGAYVRGQSDTPSCYAFAPPEVGEKRMSPHEASRDKQHDQCTGCPHNRFGTALQGKGKRCNDTRRVLCIVETKDPDSIKTTEVRMLSVPKGSLRNWGNYMDAIKDLSATGSPSAVVTEAGVEPLDGGAYALTFKPIAKLTREQALPVMARFKAEESKLYQPWPEIQKDEEAKPAAKRSARANAKL